jgi:aminoglycoside phosphotransferase family enzyme
MLDGEARCPTLRMSAPEQPPRSPHSAANHGDLAARVAWLRSRLGTGDEAIETHFAWVFLVGDRAWKLRKPVCRDPMDYRGLESRRVGAGEEVRLNRRLAPGAYLGTRPLTWERGGHFAIDGRGEVVDWLVEMRRLDRGRMLDVLLAQGRVTAGDLHRIADVLADFYAREPAAVSEGAALAARLHTQILANHDVLGTLDAAGADRLHAVQAAFLAAHPEWLAVRAAEGCVVEGHGDLRPEHIVLDDPPVVIDCLEFDRNLRVLDHAEELEFLALECARIGHAAAGEAIGRECRARLGDDAPEPLRRFYRSHRAATRAKLYVWRASEPDDGSTERWFAAAREYLELALDAAQRATG